MATAASVVLAAAATTTGAVPADASPASSRIAGAEVDAARGVAGAGHLARTCAARTGSSFALPLTAVDGAVYFTTLVPVPDVSSGQGLWTSDGTDAGPVLLKTFPDQYLSWSRASSGGSLFFTPEDSVHGQELWTSDGTVAGTVLVKDIDPGLSASEPVELTDVAGTLFFSAYLDQDSGPSGRPRALWKSDGTTAGTIMVREVAPWRLTDVAGTLFFTTNDGVHGEELWKSDGTQAGTVMVKDIAPGPTSAYPQLLTEVDGQVFFEASDDVHGTELWKSDGTAAGTVMVKDITPGNGPTGYQTLADVDGTVFFTPDDGVHGHELWKSDGTAAGTVLVKDIKPGRGSSVHEDQLAVSGGQLFLEAKDGTHGWELWRSDGTRAGTRMVRDINPISRDRTGTYEGNYLTDVAGTLFFVDDDGKHGFELWKSDGTRAGTVMVRDVHPGRRGSTNLAFRAVTGATLFFSADDGVHGIEPWKSDGTRTGTRMVKDINTQVPFIVPTTGKRDRHAGTIAVEVSAGAAGRVTVRPVGGSLVKKTNGAITASGTATITLGPTRAGMRQLRRTGHLHIVASFDFAPCDGTGSTQTRSYVLRLRR